MRKGTYFFKISAQFALHYGTEGVFVTAKQIANVCSTTYDTSNEMGNRINAVTKDQRNCELFNILLMI